MVSLELRETDVTRVADVVLPVAPVTDKAGTFVTWDGRARSFDAVFANPASLPDLRVLSGIADELGTARSASARSPRSAPRCRRSARGTATARRSTPARRPEPAEGRKGGTPSPSPPGSS